MFNRSFAHGLTRRAFLIAGGSAAFSAGVPAQTQWPNRPIKLIVPFAPGGSNDILSRMIGEKLGARLGQSVVIENKGGAGGTIGTDAVAKAAPDGYTLLFASGSITTNAAAGKKLPYDLMKDLEPIGKVAVGPYVVVVSNDLKVATLREFIDLARAKPKTINYGSAGTGGLNHLGTELFASAAKIQLARALAITGDKRSPLAPDLPTVAEAGLPGFKMDVWWGLLGPAKMPAQIVKRLNGELNAVLALPEVRELFAREGAVPQSGTPAEFRGLIGTELTRWTQLIKDSNIQIE